MNKQNFDYKRFCVFLSLRLISPNIFKFIHPLSSRQTGNRKIRSISYVSRQRSLKKKKNPRITIPISNLNHEEFLFRIPRAEWPSIRSIFHPLEPTSRSFLRYILARGSHPRNKRPSFWPRAKDDPLALVIFPNSQSSLGPSNARLSRGRFNCVFCAAPHSFIAIFRVLSAHLFIPRACNHFFFYFTSKFLFNSQMRCMQRWKIPEFAKFVRIIFPLRF